MDNAEPIIAPLVAKRLAHMVQRPPHGLLLSGQAGSGKGTLARWLAAQLLQSSTERLNDHPYVTIVTPQGTSISIEQIRDLEKRLQLRVPGTNTGINRVVIIEQADLMTSEAQNALLKTLEEPPQGTILIVTADNSEQLLPTVRSRLQTIVVTLPSADLLRDALRKQGCDSTTIQRIMAMSGGLPGLAISVANDDSKHPLYMAAQTARQLLQSGMFERLAMVDALSKDRQQSRSVVAMLLQMSHAALLTGKATARWQQVMESAYEAERSFEENAQPKLVLSRLMLTL